MAEAVDTALVGLAENITNSCKIGRRITREALYCERGASSRLLPLLDRMDGEHESLVGDKTTISMNEV